MSNIIEYSQNELKHFSEAPFNAVDSLILSQLLYLRIEKVFPSIVSGSSPAIRIKDLLKAEYFDRLFVEIFNPDKAKQLLFYLAASPRFRDIVINNCVQKFDSESETQFFAATFCMDNDERYLCFRGTDMTVVGWKEDFNMAYAGTVPSQDEGARYVKQAAEVPGALLLGGHSKGGNIAVYSAMNSPFAIQRRIKQVFSHDGPGFTEDILSDVPFYRIADKINKTLPQSSVIGMLLQSQESYRIVKSNKLGGILQHDPFSWETEGSDFLYVNKLSTGTGLMNKTLNSWISGMSTDQRGLFIDTLFNAIANTGANTLVELASEWKINVPAVFRDIRKLPPDDKKVLKTIFKELRALAVTNIKNN